MFFAINVEDRIAADHPLRPIRRMVDAELARLAPVFAAAYSRIGRPSVPPERLLKAMLLQCLYSIRSERQVVDRLNTDLLFRWFVGMDPAEDCFDATAFTHNRPRLEEHGVIAAFFNGVVKRAVDAGLTSDEHFSVDGTLIESHASMKSFRPIDGQDDSNGDSNGDSNCFKSRNPDVDFRGQKRSNETHRSRTDPEARLYRKSAGQESRLCHLAHAITENRNGLVMAVTCGEACGTGEADAALRMVDDLCRRQVRVDTLGADKGYDSGPLMLELEERGITPHVAMNLTGPGREVVGGRTPIGRRSKADVPKIEARQRMQRRLAGGAYYASSRCRKKIEEGFGWLKTVAGLARTRLVGRWKLSQQVHLAAAAYNLVRMRKLPARAGVA